MKNTIYLITIIVLIVIAYIDFKQRLIPDKFNIIIAILGIINILFDTKNLKIYLVSTLIVFAFFLFLAVVSDGGIGGGDIKLFTALSLIFGKDIIYILLFTYLLAFITAIPMLIFKKYKLNTSVALAPFIMLGTITYFII